jgi:hypothetical protein
VARCYTKEGVREWGSELVEVLLLVRYQGMSKVWVKMGE